MASSLVDSAPTPDQTLDALKQFPVVCALVDTDTMERLNVDGHYFLAQPNESFVTGTGLPGHEGMTYQFNGLQGDSVRIKVEGVHVTIGNCTITDGAGSRLSEHVAGIYTFTSIDPV